MLPAGTDALAWVARELSLTLLEDDEAGFARSVSGAPPEGGETLRSATARTLGLGRDDAALLVLIERAREGGEGVLDVSGPVPGRLLAWAIAPGRARVLFVPRSDAIARRAATADLAAGVTHEVANALTAIAGWTRMAAASGPLPDRTRHALDIVQRSARDALGTARSLLSAMRDTGRTIGSAGAEHTNVSQIVGEVIETLRPELEEAGIAIEAELVGDAWGTTPPAALRLIIGNLVRNAFEALASGGRIRVSVRVEEDRICLSVADDGPGMSARTLAHAFDRYFTTKEHGTGLGLALLRDTVDEAGGRVEVESARGTGTRFDIWLPAMGAPRLSLSAPQVTAASSGVHHRPALIGQPVLVVDDDEATRSLVRTALELLGAQVHTASGVTEALAIERESFALVLVDLALGADRGDRLLATLRADGRAQLAILLTGSPDTELAPEGAPDAVLRKPFELEELARVIDGVLERSASAAKA